MRRVLSGVLVALALAGCGSSGTRTVTKTTESGVFHWTAGQRKRFEGKCDGAGGSNCGCLAEQLEAHGTNPTEALETYGEEYMAEYIERCGEKA
jgi:hypothetical protein